MVNENEPDEGADRPIRKRRFGFWDHYGWKLPANFDDPDPEIEALFYGEGKPDGEL